MIMIMKKVKKQTINEHGSILFVVITFLFVTELILLLTFKVYFSSEELIINHNISKKEYNNYLEPKITLLDNIKTFPSKNTSNIDFNNIFNDAHTCKDKTPLFTNSDFVSSKFCNLSELKKNIYVGNIISKSNLILTSPTLITSGNILINHTLTLTSNITFIYSFGDIEINYLKGNDSAMTYFVYLESYTKNINIQNDSNVVVLNSEPFIVKIIFPQYKKNILLIR